MKMPFISDMMRKSRVMALGLLALAALFVLTSLCGCGNKGAAHARQVHLTLACWEGPEGLASLGQLLDRYKKQHPNVSIEIQQVPGNQYYQRLQIQFAAGVAPDIMQLAYDHLPMFADKNTIEPLDHLIKRDHFPVDGMFPELLPALKYQGQFYGLPRGWTTFVLYYNKDMFKKAHLPFPHDGWKWDEFLADCKKLTQDTDGDGRIDQFGCDAPLQMDAASYWVWQNGGLMFSPDMKKCLLNSPETEGALRFLQDCEYKYHVFPTPAQSQDLGGGGEMFRQGKQAMYIEGRWACQSFRDAKYPNGKLIDWDVAPPPMNKQKATMLFANCYVLRKNGPNLDEAWKLMQWLTGPEGQKHQALTGRDMPSFVSIAKSPAFLDPVHLPEHDEVFLDVAKYARPLQIDAKMGAWGEPLVMEIQQVFLAHKDVDKAMNSAVSTIDKILQEAPR